MPQPELDRNVVLAALNEALELEFAGVVRYTHYSFMLFGHDRIPLVDWMRQQATESLTHAQQIGEWITTLGGHPSLKIGPLLETHSHTTNDILAEVLEHEKEGLAVLHRVLPLVEGKYLALEEFVRTMVVDEEMHVSEVEKMIRQPGDLDPAR